jgi:hypothetical protein
MMSEGDDLIPWDLLNLISQRCEHNRAYLNALKLAQEAYPSEVRFWSDMEDCWEWHWPQGRGRRFDNSRHETYNVSHVANIEGPVHGVDERFDRSA